MKRAAIIVSVIVGLLLLAAAAIIVRPPAGMIGQRLVAQIREATGREFTIKGGTAVSLGWKLKVRMDDVTLANPAGVAGDPLLAARTVEVETAAIPALTGRSAAVDVLRLVEPRVRLVRDAAGKDNWTFPASGSSKFAVGDLQVKGGHLALDDAQSKTTASIDGVDGSASNVSRQGVDSFTLTGTKAVVDLSGATGTLDQPALSGKKATPDSIAELDAKGAKLKLTGLGDGLSATLEAPRINAKGLSANKLDQIDVATAALDAGLPGGAAALLETLVASATGLKSELAETLVLKANSAHYASGDGLQVSLDGVAADAKSLSPEEVGALVLDARAARYKLADGASGSLDTIHADQRGITPEAIAELAITGTALKHAASDGMAIDLGGYKAAAKKLTPDGIGDLKLDAGTLGYKLADGSSGAFSTLHADGHGITRDGAADIVLKSDGLKHTMAGGVAVELAGLGATAKALTRASLGEGTLTAASFAATEGEVRTELAKVEASTRDAKLPGPLDVALAFDWKGERVAGTVKLDALAMPTEVKPLALSVAMKARDSSLSLDGTLSADRAIEGRTTTSVKSVRDIAKWLGIELPQAGPLGAASVDGRIKATAKRLELIDAAMALDATKAKGSLVVDISGERPSISGSLAADAFDADAYGFTSPSKRDGAPTAAAVLAEAADTPPPPTLKEALKAFVRAEAERLDQPPESPAAVAAARKAPAWSSEPIDFSFLKKADVDVALKLDKLRLAGLDVAVPSLKTKLDDGVLSLDGRDLALKGGKVTGRAAIEARSGEPRVAANFKADNVEALDILDALGLTSVVAGKSSIEADLGAGIGSQKKLVESVTGSVKVKMGRGAVIGYDPGDIFSYITGNGRYNAKSRWPFSRLDADMSLDKGLSKNTRVSVDTAVAGANSDGTTDLPKREIDYKAKLNVSFWFQPILVRIFGAWSSPKWAADMFDTSQGVALTSAEKLRRLDLRDPELAAMIGELLEKSAGSAQPLDPAVADTLRLIKTQAEAR